MLIRKRDDVFGTFLNCGVYIYLILCVGTGSEDLSQFHPSAPPFLLIELPNSIPPVSSSNSPAQPLSRSHSHSPPLPPPPPPLPPPHPCSPPRPPSTW